MAIFYYDEYSRIHNSRNFGDDINPKLLGHFFNRKLIESEHICLFGIGTILNERNFGSVRHFEKKVIFTSGSGYGEMPKGLINGCDVACVRGPKTAALLGLPPEKAIADGAILLALLHSPLPDAARERPLFIPHVNTHWAAGEVLQDIAQQLGLDYISPDAPFEDFIQTVRQAEFVVAEAMHGAILADAMRTPWIPVHMLHHNSFKWRDMFGSLNMNYESYQLGPVIWNESQRIKVFLKRPFLKQKLKSVLSQYAPVLSGDEVLEERLKRLQQQIDRINVTYV